MTDTLRNLLSMKRFNKIALDKALASDTNEAWIAYDKAVTKSYEANKKEAEEIDLSLEDLMGPLALTKILAAHSTSKMQ